jgi:signal transduction histidine kinase
MGREKDPERSLAALGVIEDIARQTVAEIDRLVGNLREGPAATGHVEAPAGLASVDSLVAQVESVGVEVRLEAIGTRRPLASSVDQAAYRILQEALTNAARHGGGPVHVGIRFTEGALELAVANAVPPVTAAKGRIGHGIVGMRERAGLFGGRLSAERVNGSFEVRAELPYPAVSR